MTASIIALIWYEVYQEMSCTILKYEAEDLLKQSTPIDKYFLTVKITVYASFLCQKMIFYIFIPAFYHFSDDNYIYEVLLFQNKRRYK